MGMIDPEQERQRLREFYSRQLDGRLEQIATQAAGMTDLAKEVLREELVHRGLNVGLLQSALAKDATTVEAPREEPPSREEESSSGGLERRTLVAVRRFRDLPEALLAKSSLDSAAIESFLEDDNMIRMDWFISNLLGGIKLLVDAEDADVANEILSQPIPDNFLVEGVGEYQQPRCPQCRSMDVSFEALEKSIAYGSFFVGIPVPVHRKGWICHACKHAWAENEAETNASPD